MFDIGWSELLVIGVIALVVVGPRELPGLLRQVGRMMAGVRRMASDFQSQFNEAMREAELDGLRKEVDELRRTASGFTNPAALARDHLRDAIEKSTETKPAVPAPTEAIEALPETTAPSFQAEPVLEPAADLAPRSSEAGPLAREAGPVPPWPAPTPSTSEAVPLPGPDGEPPLPDRTSPEPHPVRQP